MQYLCFEMLAALRQIILLAAITLTSAGVHAQPTAPSPPDLYEDWEVDPSASSPKEEAPETQSASPAFQRKWTNFSRLIAKRFIRHEDSFIVIDYDPLFDNTSRELPTEVASRLSRVVTERSGNMSVDRRITPPNSEIEAVTSSLREMCPGEYGMVHSWKIEQILGPEEMIVSSIWLIDADALKDEMQAVRRQSQSRDDTSWFYEQRQQLASRQRGQGFKGYVKVLGIPTETARVGQRWLGVKPNGQIPIAVIAESQWEQREKNKNRRQRGMLLMPAERFKKHLTETEFVELLSRHDITREQFVDKADVELRKGSKGLSDRLVAFVLTPPSSEPTSFTLPVVPANTLPKKESVPPATTPSGMDDEDW